MKGSILKGIEEMVKCEYGESVWLDIVSNCRISNRYFIMAETYDDNLVFEVIKEVSKIGGLTEDELLRNFGIFWINDAAQKIYPTLFCLAGKSAQSFLLNIGRLHYLVTRNLLHTNAPTFEIERSNDKNMLSVSYSSSRKMCALMKGLIEGVGKYFKEPLEITETKCIKKGDNKCVMEVVFK